MKEVTLDSYSQRLKTKAGRNEIVSKLKDLIASDGWKILCLYLLQEKEGLQLQMDDINKDMTLDQLQKIRIRLYYVKDLMAMPETFIKDISEIEDREVVSEVY